MARDKRKTTSYKLTISRFQNNGKLWDNEEQFVRGRRIMSKRNWGQSENSAAPCSGHHTMGIMLFYGYPSHLFPPVKSESYYDYFSIYWLLILVSRLPSRPQSFVVFLTCAA